jgi:hypothetical protein
MNFIKRFLFAWRSARVPDYILDADQPDFWTDADARTLEGYFKSDSGKKLKAILTNYVLRSAVEATQKRITCGHARGIASTVSILERHVPGQESQLAETLSEAEQAFLESIGA